MKNRIPFALLCLSTLCLPACGIFSGGDTDPLQVQNVGPSINDVLKPLPKDLVGDEDNKLYGFDELRPAAEEGDPL